MITTTFKCDKCKGEQSDQKQFWTLGVGYAHYPTKPVIGQTLSIQVCRPCLESFGLLANPAVKPPSPPPPTTEDLIIEVLARCGIEPVA